MHFTVKETLPHSTRAILASGASVSRIQLRNYMFYVFEGDWIYNAMVPANRDLTAKSVAERVAAGKLVASGRYGGDFQAPDQALCRRFIEKFGACTLADIGANYGHEGMRYGLLAREIGVPMTRYVTVEPGRAGLVLPTNLMLQGFGDAHIVAGALSGTDGIDLLHFAENVTTGGTLTFNPKGGRVHAVPVRLAKWDTLAAEMDLSGPTFFKIDIQGAEQYFLDCAANYLRDNTCAGIVEFLPSDFPSTQEASDFLERFSKDYYLVDVGLYRNKFDPLNAGFSDFTETLKTQEKNWTDVLFYPRFLGPDFMS